MKTSKISDVVIFPELRLIEKMFQVCAEQCPDFLPLLWAYMKTGCRKAEGINFLKAWVRRKERRPVIVQEKTDKQVRPSVDPDFHALMLACYDDPQNRTEYLFVDEEGRRWNEKKVERRLKIIRANMGLYAETAAKYVACNTFRHTFATAVTVMFGIASTAEYIGHADITLTRRYYTNIDMPYVDKADRVLPWQIRAIHGDRVGKINLPPAAFEIVNKSEAAGGGA